jgi:hypothetical protein
MKPEISTYVWLCKNFYGWGEIPKGKYKVVDITANSVSILHYDCTITATLPNSDMLFSFGDRSEKFLPSVALRKLGVSNGN